MNSIDQSNKQIEVEVCLGNCCYLNGSNEIIKELKRLIDNNNLSDRVIIKPKTCLDNCSNAPVIKIDDQLITNLNIDTLKDIIAEYL